MTLLGGRVWRRSLEEESRSSGTLSAMVSGVFGASLGPVGFAERDTHAVTAVCAATRIDLHSIQDTYRCCSAPVLAHTTRVKLIQPSQTK